MRNWIWFVLVSSVYGSCCCVGPSPAEKYDNQLLGHLTLKISTVYSFPHLNTSGQHIKTISQLCNRLTLANTAQEDRGLIKELKFCCPEKLSVQQNYINWPIPTVCFTPSTVIMQNSVCVCVCMYTAQYSTDSWQINSHTANHTHVCGAHQVITHASNRLLKWKMSHASITALLLPDNYSSTSFSYISNCYCLAQTALSLTYKKKEKKK